MSPRKKQDVSFVCSPGDRTNLDETVPPCEHCEKYFFYQHSTFNFFDASFLLISMATYLVDIVTDMIVCVQYLNANEYFWGFLTLFFTIAPSIIVHIFSARWYLIDDDMTTSDWLLHVFQLGTLKRYVCVFQTGLEARRSHDASDFELLCHQQSDVSMLRLFESFMESAPQIVLQLYIMVATNDENYFTGVSAAVSLTSLCWAIAAYSKAQRKIRIDKERISWPGLVFQTIWRIGMVSSRVMALVLFASVFKAFIFPVVGAHWLLMLLWVYQQNTDFCSSWLEERLFNVIISIVYIFCFFNLKEGTSRFRIVAFYTVMLVEDTMLVVLWTVYSDQDNQYNAAGYSIVYGGFIIGILSMGIYYRCFHPSGQISLSTTILKDIEKHCPHDHLYTNPRNSPKSPGLDAEISFRSRSMSPQDSSGEIGHSFTSDRDYQLNYSLDKSSTEESSFFSSNIATQRSLSDSCLLDLTTRVGMQKINNQGVNCLTQDKLTYELGLTFTDYRLNCTGFASILAGQYDMAKETALASSNLDQATSENHIESTPSQGKVNVKGSDGRLDITQGSSLQEMPNLSLQSPGLMTRYEAEKIYLDILDLERTSVPSKRQLVFRSVENVAQKDESHKTKQKEKAGKEQVVEPSSKMVKKRHKPYILWKLEEQRKNKPAPGDENKFSATGDTIEQPREPRTGRQIDIIPKTNEDCSASELNGIEKSIGLADSKNTAKSGDHYKIVEENRQAASGEVVGLCIQDFKNSSDSLNNARTTDRAAGLPGCPLKESNSTVNKSVRIEPTISKKLQPDGKQPMRSPLGCNSLGHGRAKQSVAIPRRKHSFKSAVPRLTLSHSPSDSSNKENSPCTPSSTNKNTGKVSEGFDADKGITSNSKTLKSPVLQEIALSNKLANSQPTNTLRSCFDVGGKSAQCSPSVRSLQLAIFSPDNQSTPGTREKKMGRRSLGKIPLNTVADKISIFTN
ncbi:uncharacterized protein LOC117101940 [Anneissia japonica]|uniref:uncharacterized protein LOC117101940 n=1 Tax=Anneissia japonica TaxID=1529436 RepID=UPI00142577FC|nr:uncharacterized protein LOC117101940 [Anneissia japonica]